MSKDSGLSDREEYIIEQYEIFLDAVIEQNLCKMIPKLEAGDLDWRGIQKMCGYYRRAGISRHVLGGGIQPVSVGLMQSAGAFLYFLLNASDDVKVTSHNEPFFDAVGGGFFDCAGEIARNSRSTWNPDFEYEEEFLYTHVLQKHFFLAGSDEDCQALLARHEEVSQGGDRVQRDICRAFLLKDGVLFESSLLAKHKQNVRRIRELENSEMISVDEADGKERVPNEGLALVRLAQLAELDINLDGIVDEMGYAVSELLNGPDFAFDGEAWKTIEYSPATKI